MVVRNYQIEDSDLAISTTTGEGNHNVLVLSRDGIIALRMPLGDAGIVAMQDNNNQYVFTGRQYNNQGTFQLKIPMHEEDHEEYGYRLYFNNFLVCDFTIDLEIDGAREFYNKLLQIGGLVEVEEEEAEEEEEEEVMNQNGGRRRRTGRKTKRARRRMAAKRPGTRKSGRR